MADFLISCSADCLARVSRLGSDWRRTLVSRSKMYDLSLSSVAINTSAAGKRTLSTLFSSQKSSGASFSRSTPAMTVPWATSSKAVFVKEFEDAAANLGSDDFFDSVLNCFEARQSTYFVDYGDWVRQDSGRRVQQIYDLGAERLVGLLQRVERVGYAVV